MTTYGGTLDNCRQSGLMVLVIVCILGLAGCASHSGKIQALHSSFYQGDIKAASEQTAKLLEKKRRDAILLQLDQSILNLADGQPELAEKTLREIRDRFATPDALSGVGNITTWIADDRTRRYQPDDYERLFVMVFLTLSNLLQDGDDAFAYSHQLTNLQATIESGIQERLKRFAATNETAGTPARLPTGATPNRLSSSNRNPVATASLSKPVVEFKQIALAPLVSGILAEQTHRDYYTAERFYQRALAFNPQLKTAADALQRVRTGHHSQSGNGVLHVFVAVGKGPYKVEQEEIPTSQALLIADRILSELGDHTLPPTLAPIKTSRIVVPHNRIKAVRVLVDQADQGTTEPVTDLGLIAKQQSEAKHPMEVARAIVRRVVKKSAIYAGKDALDTVNNSVADMIFNLGGILWEASESADTRCWGLLPETVQILRIELPAGRHRVQLVPVGEASSTFNESTIEIRDGQNTYLFANFPSGNRVGKIISSSDRWLK